MSTRLILKVLFFALAFFLLFKFWGNIKLFFEKLKAKNEVVKYNGSAVFQVVNLAEIANIIYDAFYHASVWGVFEDEETAINALMQVRRENVPELAKIYAGKGKNLYSDFVRFLSPDQYKEIKNLLS